MAITTTQRSCGRQRGRPSRRYQTLLVAYTFRCLSGVAADVVAKPFHPYLRCHDRSDGSSGCQQTTPRHAVARTNTTAVTVTAHPFPVPTTTTMPCRAVNSATGATTACTVPLRCYWER